MNLNIPISDSVAAELSAVASTEGKTPEQVVAALVERFLEDREDLADALEALSDGEAHSPLDQVKRDLPAR
jgi:predicted DNA-binding protein